MSPTKSKATTPPKKNTKPKTPTAKTKPPVTSTRRKSSKTAVHSDKTHAVAGGLTSAKSAAPEKPATKSAPKVSRAKTKLKAPDSALEGSVAKAEPGLAKTAPAPDDAYAKESPADEEGAKAGVQALESGPPLLDVKAEKTDGEGSPRGNDAETKAPVAGSPPVVSDSKTMEHTAAAPDEESVQMAATPQSAPPPAPSVPATQPADKPLELPKGALIAFRKSGGVKFSSREIVVYPDGRVTYDGGDTAKSALTRAARRMSDAQVVRLRRTLDKINFFGMRPPKSEPDPDGFVIEIAARLGGKNNQLEVNAAGMPGALTALVDQLTALLPSEA